MGEHQAARILLIGWDSADWRLIHPLLDSGRMPHLAGLVEGGVMGNIASLEPMLSPVLWTSVATGVRGDRHGILGFTEPDPEAGGIRPVRSTSRRRKALWNILTQAGLKSIQALSVCLDQAPDHVAATRWLAEVDAALAGAGKAALGGRP